MKNVFYINLDERADRKKNCEFQLNELGWKYERFPAIKHKKGEIGCAMSHLKILQIAKQRKLDYVIIFEDDFLIIDSKKFKEKFKNIIKNKPYFDVLKLGANPYPPYKQVTEDYVKLNYSQTTHAYMVLSHYYDILIKNYKESIELLEKYGTGPSGIFACDVWQNILIQEFNHTWLLLNPLLVSQQDGYSNIEKKDIDYNWVCLNLKNSNRKMKIKKGFKYFYPVEHEFYGSFMKKKINLLLNNYNIIQENKNIKNQTI